jgi:hypothetical protein
MTPGPEVRAGPPCQPRGRGASGMLPAAYLEVWVWSLDPVRVTFAGQFPRGSKEWRIAIWKAIAAEALHRAAEEEAGHVLPPPWIRCAGAPLDE